jgi:hypothetical protein
MTTFTIRLLALAIFATPMMAIPVVSPANAATNDSKHVKKHAKSVHRAPAVQSAKSQNPFPSYDDDFDRKNAGGGGGY